MGAKTWMLVYSNSDVGETLASRPPLDRERSALLVAELFPTPLTPADDTNLLWTSPDESHVHVGCYSEVSIIAASEFGADYPSRLPERFLNPQFGSRVHLHAMHSVVDWFAFAVWENQVLQRSLSVSPDHGVIENLGEPLGFERAYWAGERPAIDPADDDPDQPYPLPFHPLELGESALSALFGYVLEGPISDGRFDPEEFPLLAFHRSARRWWQFWRPSS